MIQQKGDLFNGLLWKKNYFPSLFCSQGIPYEIF